ncbi:MAG: 23S rRNA (uracil(1939)-C(5))-methyltransferase RlmD [Sphingomonadales bacterium]
MTLQRAQEIDLLIEDYAFGGKGIARIQTEKGPFIVFVDNAFPGQLVRTKIETKRKTFAEAKLLEVLQRAEVETVSTFQEISGGPYIHVPVSIQEQYKKESTLSTFQRLSGITNSTEKFDCFISSPAHYHYRNKMEYSFSCIEHDLHTNQELDDAFALGFKRRGTWWKVESLNKASGLFDAQWEEKLKDIRKYLQQTRLPAWHPPQKRGFFRHIVVRKSFLNDQLLVNLVTSNEGLDQFDIAAFSDFLNKLHPERIAGFWHTVNDNVADRAKIENGYSKLIFGAPVIEEELAGLRFQISMESFFQTNPACAELLYAKALDYFFEEPFAAGDIAMDLFCGTGTIGQLMAKRNPQVRIIGVDIVEKAIEDAKQNAAKNAIQSVEFYAADVGKFLKEYPDFQGKIKRIMLDPPRAGIAPKTLQKVISLGADTIIYISCNPSTQARDAASLVEAGYALEKYALVDQFPHTGHIESIAKFKKP